MARVIATIEEIFTLNVESSREIPSVMATCTRCEKTAESHGTGSASIRRCLVLLREECPRDESNYYIARGA